MKKLFIYLTFFFLIQFSALSDDLYFKALVDTKLYDDWYYYLEPDDILGSLKKNEVVIFSRGTYVGSDDGDITKKMLGVYLYNNEEYFITSNDLVPLNTERRFNHLFLTDFNSPTRKTWVPEYFVDVLKNYRELFPEYEPFWNERGQWDEYGGEGYTYWYEIFDPPRYVFSFSESALVFEHISFVIKNIKKISNGYTVTVTSGRSDWDGWQRASYDWSSILNKEFFDLTFIVDGNYMDMYLEDGMEPFITFISVDLEFLKQFESRIKTDEADLSNVTFPRRGYKTAIVSETYKTTDNLRMRSKAGTSGEIITTIQKGNTVTILEIGKQETIENIEANWVRVQLANGQEGWVFGGYLETLPE